MLEGGGFDHLVRVFMSLLCDVIQPVHPSVWQPHHLRGGEAVSKWSHVSLLHGDVVAVFLNMLSDVHLVTNDQAHTLLRRSLLSDM